MNILFSTYPFSFGMLILGSLLGIGAAFLVFGSLSVVIICVFAWAGMLRILPIIQSLNRWIQVFFPHETEVFEQNVKESFLVHDHRSKETSSRKILCFHPHGMFSLAMFFHIATPLTQWPVEDCKATGISWFWYIPFLPEILDLLHFVPSDYGTMKSVIMEKKNLCLVLGGVREMDSVEEGQLTLVLAKRRGIFKMALETGASLVPVLTYGENEMYRPFRSDWLSKIQSWCMNHSFYLPIPTWESVKEWGCLLKKPFREPLVTHVGPEIPVEKIEGRTITEGDIRALRDRYCLELETLYAKTKPKEYKEKLVFV